MDLCDDQCKFFCKDFITHAGTTARVFSYNFASYTDWCRPSALECRGIMFEMKGEKPVRIMARPMEKFFNLGETPFTMNLDFSKVQYVCGKADGSLISSYIDKGELYFKSKTSMFSDQAGEASSLVRNDTRYEDLYFRLIELAKADYTVNMEYVSPTNRVVLDYAEPQVIVLNIRHNSTGEYVDMTELQKDPVIRKYLTDFFAVAEDFESWAAEQKKTNTEDEGYVVYMSDGLKFKVKTNWYVKLHHTKDSINSNKELVNVIATGGSDDLKAMFFDDEAALEKIKAFEQMWFDTVGRMTQDVLRAYEDLRHLERRDYAMQGQVVFAKEKFLFSVLMTLFGNGSHEKAVNGVQEMFLKYWEPYTPEAYK